MAFRKMVVGLMGVGLIAGTGGCAPVSAALPTAVRIISAVLLTEVVQGAIRYIVRVTGMDKDGKPVATDVCVDGEISEISVKLAGGSTKNVTVSKGK